MRSLDQREIPRSNALSHRPKYAKLNAETSCTKEPPRWITKVPSPFPAKPLHCLNISIIVIIMVFTKRVRASGSSAFSLVEMLVVIAVIGVIAAIAVPTIGNLTDNADEGRAQRNAQNLAAVSAVAVSAGASINFSNVNTAVDDIRDGVFGANDFSGTIFQVPGLTNAEVAKAKKHLQVAGGALEYVP